MTDHIDFLDAQDFYDVVHLDTDPGSGGYRTGSEDQAVDHAVRQARVTHRRQLIQVFPTAEQPSRNTYRVSEIDVEDIPILANSNTLETRLEMHFTGGIQNLPLPEVQRRINEEVTARLGEHRARRAGFAR